MNKPMTFVQQVEYYASNNITSVKEITDLQSRNDLLKAAVNEAEIDLSDCIDVRTIKKQILNIFSTPHNWHCFVLDIFDPLLKELIRRVDSALENQHDFMNSRED